MLERYLRQVELVARVLPHVAVEDRPRETVVKRPFVHSGE